MQVPAEFFSPGKLLLTGEYFVLHGAKALAVPTLQGQYLSVSPASETHLLEWEFQDHLAQTLFKKKWNWSAIKLSFNEADQDDYVLELLKAIHHRGLDLSGNKLVFRVNYPQAWGLGSSAAMLANMAKWTQLNPLDLFFESQSGSGYDVACSFEAHPILYQLLEKGPAWEPIQFQPAFADRLWLVYFGQKQSSAQEVKRFLKRNPPNTHSVNEMSRLSLSIATENQLSKFQELLLQHEEKVGRAIGQTPVQQRFFKDFQGVVKSLGAWGGDFMLAVSDSDASPQAYFENKGFPQVFSWKQLVG